MTYIKRSLEKSILEISEDSFLLQVFYFQRTSERL